MQQGTDQVIEGAGNGRHDVALAHARRPVVELLLLALPTVAQMASYTVMQFIDRLMLAKVGDLEASTAGTAGITYFCFLGFGFGMLLVVNTLVSQSYGRKDYHAAGRYLWQGIWFGVAFGLLTAAMYPFAEPIFLAMGHEPRFAAMEGTYFSICALGSPLKLAAVALSQFLLGLHRPNVVFVGAVCGVVADVFCNWLLIFGNWGFPALGVAGAAWGTNAAVLLELLVMGAYVSRPWIAREYNARDWRPRPALMKTLLRIGTPAGFQLIADITAWMIFMNVVMAAFGTDAVAANSFAFTYMHVCFMPAIGVGHAVTALVGKYIGAGKPDLATRRAHLGFFVCAIYMVAAGIVLGIFRHRLIGVFSDDAQIQQIGATLLLFVAAYQIFDAMFVVYVGALRGAGDTLVPAVFQAGMVWTIVVLGGFLLVWYAPAYGVAGPWALATVFGAILGFFLLIRFQRGGWKAIRLHEQTERERRAEDVAVASNVVDDSAKLTGLPVTADK